MTYARRESLERALWPEELAVAGYNAYAILDGARDDRIASEVATSGLGSASLFPGAPKVLADAGPHLVQLQKGAPFLDTLTGEAWGRSWGVLVSSPHAFELVRRELRKLLRAEMPDGKKVLFRFYDPRVLRAFLPTCTATELRAFFDLVPFYFMESDKGDALVRFHREPTGLERRDVPMPMPS
jgi:hypothetical protein